MEDKPRLAIPEKGWKLPCSACGIIIRDGESGTKVEPHFEDELSFKFITVWHEACFNAKMEEGEEI